MTKSRRTRRRGGRARRGGAGIWAGRAVIVVVLLAVLGLFGGYFWVQSFLRSERFRKLVNSRVSETLEVDAAFDKFVWDGMELRAPNFNATGENLIRRIDLEELRTEVRFAPLLSKRFESREIHARALHVEIDVTKDGPQFEEGGRKALEFSSARVDLFTGEVDFGDTSLRWEGMKGSITPGQARGSYDATLTRGLLRTPLALFPELKLQEASLRYVDRGLFVRNGEWSVFQSGRLLTDGEIDFRSGEYTFSGDLTNVQCEEVLPDDWTKRLRGELSSSFAVEGAGKRPPLITGELELARGLLTALPVLDKIAAYTGTEHFRRLNLSKARLDYRHQGELLELSKIVIASDGLRIEGKLVIDGGRLDGDFELGVTPATLASIPGAPTRVFTPGRNGMHWTPVKITGTTTFPREDLSERLVAAGFEWMYEMVDGQLVLKHSGKVAGELAKGLWETGGEAARIGVDILGQGADLLKGAIPNPLGPVRNGVGSVLDGILGNPTRRPPIEETPEKAEPPSKPKGDVLDELLEEDEEKKEGERPRNPAEAAEEKAKDEFLEEARRLIEGKREAEKKPTPEKKPEKDERE